jgi:hypothetical protein
LLIILYTPHTLATLWVRRILTARTIDRPPSRGHSETRQLMKSFKF